MVVLTFLWLMSSSIASARGVYVTHQDFLKTIFKESVPKSEILWIKGTLQDSVNEILGHTYGRLRIRYWRHADEFAWILDEIGKEEPITVGIAIKGEKIKNLIVLEYRESRGDEVRQLFFTQQFQNATLDEHQNLSQHIDGITGATLSVSALIKLSKLALFLSQQVAKETKLRSSNG